MLAACNTNKKIKKTLKRKGSVISINAVKEKVQVVIYIQSNGIPLSPKSTQDLMVSNNSHKIELYQAHRQVKKLKCELGETRSRLKEVEDTENNNTSLNNLENNDEYAVNKIIEDNNLGSTIFMSTENYLKLILTYPCRHKQNVLSYIQEVILNME